MDNTDYKVKSEALEAKMHEINVLLLTVQALSDKTVQPLINEIIILTKEIK